MSDSQSTLNSTNQLHDSLPRLVYFSDQHEYIAFRVQLKADKLELKTLESNEDKVNSNAHSKANQNEHFNLEACIMFKLSFPTIAYYKGILVLDSRV